jgi:hypothetical protein
MRIVIPTLAVVLAGAAILGGCQPECPPASQANADQVRIETEFRRCWDQAKIGDACACWSVFLAQNPPEGAERSYAEQSDRGCHPSEAQKPAGSPHIPFPPASSEDATCYQGFSVTGNLDTDIQSYGERCGLNTGMLPYTPVYVGVQFEEDYPDYYHIQLSKGECYRILAVGDADIQDLDMALLRGGPEGEALAEDTATDPFPILATGEPVCPPQTERYVIRVSVYTGQGRFAMQVWHRPEGTPPTGATAGMSALGAAPSPDEPREFPARLLPITFR